jgi:hypothetical protein
LRKHRLAVAGARLVNSILSLIEQLPVEVRIGAWQAIFPLNQRNKLEINVRNFYVFNFLYSFLN